MQATWIKDQNMLILWSYLTIKRRKLHIEAMARSILQRRR